MCVSIVVRVTCYQRHLNLSVFSCNGIELFVPVTDKGSLLCVCTQEFPIPQLSFQVKHF